MSTKGYKYKQRRTVIKEAEQKLTGLQRQGGLTLGVVGRHIGQ
jgi:hypothetical protein